MSKELTMIVLSAALALGLLIGYYAGLQVNPPVDLSMYEGVTIYENAEYNKVCFIYGDVEDGGISCQPMDD